MKVAITVTEPNLEAEVDPRFGRCAYFLVVDTDSLAFEAIENPHISAGSGAGIQSAQLLAEKGVQVVLTGNCGPNAYQTLSAVGIGVVVGCSGPAKVVLEQFKAGQLTTAGEPSVASRSGMADVSPTPADQQPSPGAGTPMGRGQQGGQGGGMGRGQGRGQGQGRGMGRGGGMGRGRGR